MHGNVIGTPVGELRTPDHSLTLRTRDLVRALQPLYDKLYEASMPLHPPWPTHDHPDPEHVGGFAHLDHEQANLVVPVNVSGNAIAIGGPAHADAGGAKAIGAAPSPVDTSGYGGFASGNQTSVDATVPVVIAGNAAALLGKATSTGDSNTAASSGGPITTEGEKGTLSGNVIALPATLTAAATANTTELLGTAKTNGHHRITTTTGGRSTSTQGTDPLSGNVIRPVTNLTIHLHPSR
ncbi:hypothetical protein [Sciscionella marina]|uniref:hypothetical protein n=1 Tax=Sciscionella marina TaxID=508770 RepID=UPI0012F6E682|nr:hypothetical protein [Sciscionella marina]